jgi:HEAT repeat protein
MSPLRKAICAAWCLKETDAAKRATGLRAFVPDRGPLETALRDLVSGDRASEYAALEPSELEREIVRRLLPHLSSDDPDVRAGAASLLGLLGSPDAVPALGGLISDRDGDVRMAAVVALWEIHDPRTLGPLVRAARGSDSYVGASAVAAIAEVGGRRAREALIEVVGDSRLARKVRAGAAARLRATNDPAAQAAAERYLATQRPQWHRAFYIAGLLYVMAFFASRPNSGKAWRVAYYAAVVGSVIVLVNPVWLIVGEKTAVFWGLAVLYPLGLGLGSFPILWLLKRLGQVETAQAMGKRLSRSIFVIWGSLAVWVVVVFLLMLVGLALAWR